MFRGPENRRKKAFQPALKKWKVQFWRSARKLCAGHVFKNHWFFSCLASFEQTLKSRKFIDDSKTFLHVKPLCVMEAFVYKCSCFVILQGQMRTFANAKNLLYFPRFFFDYLTELFYLAESCNIFLCT